MNFRYSSSEREERKKIRRDLPEIFKIALSMGSSRKMLSGWFCDHSLSSSLSRRSITDWLLGVSSVISCTVYFFLILNNFFFLKFSSDDFFFLWLDSFALFHYCIAHFSTKLSCLTSYATYHTISRRISSLLPLKIFFRFSDSFFSFRYYLFLLFRFPTCFTIALYSVQLISATVFRFKKFKTVISYVYESWSNFFNERKFSLKKFDWGS